jgi:hypothetical protein
VGIGEDFVVLGKMVNRLGWPEIENNIDRDKACLVLVADWRK